MGFSSLLGNEQLKNQLEQTFSQGRPSHAYLVTGPKGSGKRTLAKLLAAAYQCTGAGAVPCGVCPACRKVAQDIHPDVITVDDPDKVQVSVATIRELQEQAYIRPNEGKRKVFYLPRSGQMLPPAQNALLKLMEEPPTFGAFVLVAPSPENLLPTIRSRCVTLRMSPLPADLLQKELEKRQFGGEKLETAVALSGGFLGQAIDLLEQEQLLHPAAEQFAKAYASGDDLALLSLFPPLEKKNRQELQEILSQIREVIGEALLASRGGRTLHPYGKEIAKNHSPSQLFALCGQLQQAMEDCRGNVNGGNILANLHRLL